MLFRQIVVVGALGLAIQAAMAHTQYVVPFNFDVEKDVATLQASAAEEFFIPDHALKADFALMSPDGKTSKIDAATAFKEVTILEANTHDKGTYKISTHSERTGKQALVDGKWVMVRSGQMPAMPPAANGSTASPGSNRQEQNPGRRFLSEADLKPGTQTVETSTTTQAVTYVTRGAPTDTVLKTTGKGFELDLKTHPNDLNLDQGLGFVVLLNGKPVPDAVFQVHRGGVKGDSKEVTSDAKGMVNIKFDQPGAYLLETSYPNPPKDPAAKPLTQRYVYTLSFEVSQ